MFLCQDAGDHFVVSVAGPIDSHAVEDFQLALNQAMASTAEAVVIDLSSATLICS